MVAIVLGALTASAEPGPGLFTGDQWRYRRADLFTGLATRIVADLVAIPSGAPGWGPSEWVLLGATVGSTVALSSGRPSLDVLFQSYLQREVLGEGHFTIWNTTGDLVIWSSAAIATLSTLVYGLVSGDDPATETATLMIEAFAVAQIYHQMIKLLVGRAGPNRPELEGQYLGPAAAIRLWPSGTPSGHMASMYAMLSVIMTYWDQPVLWVALNLFAFAFGAALVGDNYHWASDVLLGAGIGFCVGRWVVEHRSTRFHYGLGGVPVRVNVIPLVISGSGGGLAAVVSF